MKKTIATLSALLFLGAGCFGSSPAPAPTPAPEPIPEPTECPDVCAAICAGLPEPEVPSGCALPMCACDQPISEQGSDDESSVSVALAMSMDAGNFFFTPSTITAAAGQTVNVTIDTNEGFHTLVIDEIDFKASVKAGETITFTAPATPGSYEFYCDVGSHRAMGMKGTLIVE